MAKDKEKVQLWTDRFNQWLASGKSGMQWCREQNIHYKLFVYWKSRLLPCAMVKKDSFIELQDEQTTGIKLEYQGIQIHLEKDFDYCTLMQCLKVVKNLC